MPTDSLEFGAACLERSACDRVIADTRRELERRAALLEARRQSGFVRQCHGDLHLRNIVLLDGRPTLFDGVEFNDEIACTDVFYDLAFLLMDLWRRRLAAARQRGDEPLSLRDRRHRRPVVAAALPLLPGGGPRQDECHGRAAPERCRPARGLQSLARQYLAMAGELLHPPPPSLIAIGGFSGSGKSTLALSLAPHRRRRARRRGSSQRRDPETPVRRVAPRPPRRQGLLAARQRAGLHEPRRNRGARPSQRAERHRRCGLCPQPPTGRPSSASPHAPRCRLRGCGWTHRNPRSSPVPNGVATTPRTPMPRSSGRNCRAQTGRIDWHRIDASGDAAAVAAHGLAYLRRQFPQATNGVSHALA